MAARTIPSSSLLPETALTARARESMAHNNGSLPRELVNALCAEIERLTSQQIEIAKIIPRKINNGEFDLTESAKAFLFEEARERIHAEWR